MAILQFACQSEDTTEGGRKLCENKQDQLLDLRVCFQKGGITAWRAEKSYEILEVRTFVTSQGGTKSDF